jgi:hypothetical protein
MILRRLPLRLNRGALSGDRQSAKMDASRCKTTDTSAGPAVEKSRLKKINQTAAAVLSPAAAQQQTAWSESGKWRKPAASK